MIRKLVFIIALFPLVGYSQQTSILSHYYENLTMFNPSMTGLNQHTTIAVNARQQWYNFTPADDDLDLVGQQN